jgi:hypothetical protein
MRHRTALMLALVALAATAVRLPAQKQRLAALGLGEGNH